MAASEGKAAPEGRRKYGREDYGVVVGWKHTPMHMGIALTVQSTAHSVGSGPDEIDSRHLVMTRNQALILAKSLLDATGQTLPETMRPGKLRMFARRLMGG